MLIEYENLRTGSIVNILCIYDVIMDYVMNITTILPMYLMLNWISTKFQFLPVDISLSQSQNKATLHLAKIYEVQ